MLLMWLSMQGLHSFDSHELHSLAQQCHAQKHPFRAIITVAAHRHAGIRTGDVDMAESSSERIVWNESIAGAGRGLSLLSSVYPNT